MAFREKSAWITLVTTLVVYGIYFALAVPRLLAGRFGGFEFVAWLSTAVVMIVALQVGLTIAAAFTDPAGAQQPRDEHHRADEPDGAGDLSRRTRAGARTW